MFLIEDAMNNLVDVAIPRVLKTLNILDGIECRLAQALDYLPASKVGSIDIRPDHTDQLEREYHRWSARLCDILGIAPYPYSERNRNGGGPNYGNVKVRR